MVSCGWCMGKTIFHLHTMNIEQQLKLPESNKMSLVLENITLHAWCHNSVIVPLSLVTCMVVPAQLTP
jgi:hypothetical protein